MTCSVLVPLDGSDFAEHAISPAIEMARNLEAGLELVSVIPDYSLIAVGDPAVATIPPAISEGEKQKLGDYLDGIAGRLRESGVPGVTTTTLRGEVARELEARSKEIGCTLIVMCTHGRGPISRAWLGSVTDELVRHANVPVLVVRPHGKDERVEYKPRSFRRVLVPLDGTETAECCLDWAIRTARVEHAAMELLWVTFPGDHVPTPMGPAVAVDGATSLDHRNVAEAYLNEKVKIIEARGLQVNTHVSSATQVAPEILHQAEALGADLIVMGTHGRSGLARAALGSVTDKVVRGAEAPVLVVRKPD